jgi:hypothetical protein
VTQNGSECSKNYFFKIILKGNDGYWPIGQWSAKRCGMFVGDFYVFYEDQEKQKFYGLNGIYWKIRNFLVE